MTSPSGPRLLVVQHQDDCPPALLGGWLEEAGAVLDVCRPYAGEELPADLAGHDGLVVLGGSMGAHDDHAHPWLAATRALFRVAAEDGAPALGICLGHQLAAVAFGGEACPNPRGQQLGLVPVGWTPSAGSDPLAKQLTAARVAVQWNDDVVTQTPAGTVVLAQTTAGELQVARYATSVWGIQAHPEVDDRILAEWAAEDPDRYAEGEIEAVLEDIRAAREQLEADWRALATSLLTLTRCQPVQ